MYSSFVESVKCCDSVFVADRSRERQRNERKPATAGIWNSRGAVRKAQRPNQNRASCPKILCANLGGDATEEIKAAAELSSKGAEISSATRGPLGSAAAPKS